MATFQRDIDLIKLRLKRFWNTGWLILFIPMQWSCLSLLCKLHNNIIIVHIVCGIISTYAPVHVPVSSKIVHESLTRQTSLEVNKNKQNTRHSQFRQNTHSVFNGLWKHLKKFTQSEHEKHGDKKFKI